jgi:hypothetical protein
MPELQHPRIWRPDRRHSGRLSCAGFVAENGCALVARLEAGAGDQG